MRNGIDLSDVPAELRSAVAACGYDHETDDGEMLALQARILGGLR